MKERVLCDSKTISLLFLILMISGYAQGTTLDRGHQLLIDKGLQIQAQIDPIVAGNFDLDRWNESNFTSVNMSGDLSYLGLPPGLPWGRGGLGPDMELLFTSEKLNLANMVSVQFDDEQSLADSANVVKIANLVSYWRTNFPTVIGFTNQSGAQETVETMHAYMAAAQPDMLMMDSYPFLGQSMTPSPGGSPTEFYTHLQKYRLLGLGGNDGTGSTPIPYGAYLQGFTLGNSFPDNGHIMSDSEVRLNEFAAWTFGYKFTELWYYNNVGFDKYPNILFNTQNETSPTSVFYSYAESNRQSRNLGTTLVRLLSTDVRFILGQHKEGGSIVNNTLPSGISTWNSSDHPCITAITATNSSGQNDNLRGDVVIGYFKPLRTQDSPSSPNEPYFMILNGLTAPNATAAQTQQSIRIDFNFGTSGITSLQRRSRITGMVEVVPLVADGGSLYHLILTLDGGTGDLFKFNTGVPFIIGSEGGLWSDVTYENAQAKNNINNGTDKAGGAYTSTKPDSGEWTMSYNLAAGANPTSIFSARYVKFLSNGPSAEKAGSLGNKDSSLVVKVSLSKYATSALWDPGSISYAVSSGSSVQLKYSTDGANFTTVYTAPTGTGSVHPSAMPLTFASGTKTIYLAYIGMVETGTQAYWSAASGGLTITPDPRVFDEWRDIMYSDNTVRSNINGGNDTGGYAYTVNAPPAGGDWVVNYNLGGSSNAVNVWSAHGIKFSSSDIEAAGYGAIEDSNIIFKLDFPQPISGVTWTMARFYYTRSTNSRIEAKWSVDGVNWTTCYTFPQINSEDPQYFLFPETISFAVPSTSSLYLGWFGTLNGGRYSYYSTAGIGSILLEPTNVSNWNAVAYNPDDGSVLANVNAGTNTGGYAYTSTKPLSSIWSENYSLAGGSNALKIWSANNLEFDSTGIMSRNTGRSNSLVVKINLSEPITSATWQPARNYTWYFSGGSVEMKYSTDGVNFTKLYSPPVGSGGDDYAPVLSMSFPNPTQTLYIGWFCTVPFGSGGSARIEFTSTGPLTFMTDPTAYWTQVSYDPASVQSNVNEGFNAGGEAYTSVKPSPGEWTFHYNANAGTNPLKIWAANYVTFGSSTINSGYDKDSRLVMKINLSEPIASANWTPTRFWYSKTDDLSNVKLAYSTDCVNFTTCFSAPNNNGENYAYPGTVYMHFDVPTDVLYLAYIGEIGTGTTAYWVGEDGSVTFYLPYYMTRNTYDTTATRNNVNNGTDQGGQAYTSTKGSGSVWTENYSLVAGTTPVKVWAADYIEFDAGGIQSRNWGDDSNTLIIKINLSEPIMAATWQPARNYTWYFSGGSVEMKYSTDGVNFTKLYSPPLGSGGDDYAPVLSMSFPNPTQTLYIGWFCTVPAGSSGSARMEFTSTGPLTFTPVPIPTHPVLNVTPLSRSVGSSAGTTTFDVSNTGDGSMSWTATVTEGGGWLSITNGASGVNNGPITVTFTQNSSTTVARTGKIQITSTGTTGSPKEVAVIQDKHLLAGDANGDGMVDVGDLGILAANYGGSGKGWSQGDFNGDGLVDVGDLGILAAHYGTNASSADWSADYAKTFGTAVADENEAASATGSSVCGAMGLPLIAALVLMGLMLVKLEE